MSRPKANYPADYLLPVFTVFRFAQVTLCRILLTSSRRVSRGSGMKSSFRSMSPMIKCTLSAKALACGFLTVVRTAVIP